MAKQIPRIVRSPFSDDRWFVVTRYTEKTGIDTETGKERPYLVAREKFDVSDQMQAIFTAWEDAALKQIARAHPRKRRT